MSSVLVALSALALSAVSSSKIGVVVLGDGSDTTSRAILEACPSLAVFRLADVPQATALSSIISSYRANCAGAKVVVQVGHPGMPVDGTTVASNWTSAWLPEILAAGQVDAVEGPSDPVPATLNSTTNVPDFWAAFVVQAANLAGATPVVGATGVPAGLGTSSDAFCATVAAIPAGTWAWSFHARSLTMSTTVATETASTLAYRQIAADCPGLAGKTLFITEAGRSSGAWHVTPSPSDLDWVAFFDGQLQQDGAGVVGAALFQASATGAVDLAPIATQLAAYLQNPTPGDGGIPDAGTDGGSDAGRGSGTTPGTNPGPGGELVPSNPRSGCSTSGPVFVMVALSPLLFALRRRAK